MISMQIKIIVILVTTILLTNSLGSYQLASAQITPENVSGDNISGEPNSQGSNLSNLSNSGESEDNPNSWLNVSGAWTSDESGIHGGTSDNKTSLTNNILLSPDIPQKDSSFSTTFRINDLDPNEANYVAIVYPFVESDTYQYAGINIFNNTIYAIFYNVSDGKVSTDPQWPGAKTDLTWIPGSVYNMSLVNHMSTYDLTVNGTTYYSSPIEQGNNTVGYAGLDYGRIKSIDYSNFITKYINQSQSEYPHSDDIEKVYTTSDSQTILLEDKMLPEGSFIHLYDSTPYKIISGHIAAKLPCNEDHATAVDILTGQAPNLTQAELEYVEPLSTPGVLCLYHVDIGSNDANPITDIAVANNFTEDIDFPESSGIVINVNEISGTAD